MVQLHRAALPRREHQHADCSAHRELHPPVGHHPPHQHQDHRQLDGYDGAQEGAGDSAQVSSFVLWRTKHGTVWDSRQQEAEKEEPEEPGMNAVSQISMHCSNNLALR